MSSSKETNEAPWWQSLFRWAIAWATKNPDKVLIGVLVVIGIAIALSTLRQPAPSTETGNRVVGEAPSGAPLSDEELARRAKQMSLSGMESALETMGREASQAIGFEVFRRCKAWESAASTAYQQQGKSPIVFYAEQAKLQSDQLLTTPPSDFQLRLTRNVEIQALKEAAAGSCGGRAIAVTTPLSLAGINDASGSVAAAAQELLITARTLDAQTPEKFNLSLVELRRAARPSSEMPVIQPIGKEQK